KGRHVPVCHGTGGKVHHEVWAIGAWKTSSDGVGGNSRFGTTRRRHHFHRATGVGEHQGGDAMVDDFSNALAQPAGEIGVMYRYPGDSVAFGPLNGHCCCGIEDEVTKAVVAVQPYHCAAIDVDGDVGLRVCDLALNPVDI